jgi:phosphonate degradation associated HDIG domain protein
MGQLLGGEGLRGAPATGLGGPLPAIVDNLHSCRATVNRRKHSPPALRGSAFYHRRMTAQIDPVECFARHGALSYEGEGVSQLQHAWQCAQLARSAAATAELQLAAWLHDIGHLLTDWQGSPTLRGIDDRHEALGAALLGERFGAAVAEPVALHVRAKRCLVAQNPAYARGLSQDSVRSLALQGGPMDAAEGAAYLALPRSRDARRLRAWDDQAKRADWCFERSAAALDELAALIDRVHSGVAGAARH